MAGPPFCSGCGAPHDRCPGCGQALDPPRFCPECGARMAVSVSPTSWVARCRTHGTSTGGHERIARSGPNS